MGSLIPTILLALAAAAFAIAAFLRRQRGVLPPGTLVYSDTMKRAVTAPINSHRYGVTGKPDYIYETGRTTTPVEVKRHRVGRYGPRPWDVTQLMAYCLLLEDNGATVREGLLEYGDKRFTLPYGSAERRKVLERVERISAERRAGTADRDHREAWRCRACGYRERCDQRLA